MEYCKAYLSKENKCDKRMSCEWYLSSLRNVVSKEDKFFEPPIFGSKDCKRYKQVSKR